MPKQTFGIAGAGIMGRLLAFQLLKQGHQVTLFDRDPIEEGSASSYTAAGMLSPFAEVESAEMLIFQMGMHSLKLWPEYVSQLNMKHYFNAGSLVVAHAADKSDLTRFNQQLQFKLRNFATNNDSFKQPEQLSVEQIAQLEPELSPQFSQATWLPQEAWLCPETTMLNLAERLLEMGVNWQASSFVESVEPHVIVAGNEHYQFDWAVDCRGLGAKKDLAQLRGVRGELIVLQAPEVKITRLIRLMHPRYRVYLVPKMHDDLYVIGATQIESNDSGPISVRSTLELLSAVYSLHSGFAEAKMIECKTNCRPALTNNLPQIQTHTGLIRINGLFRHGFLLAPTLVEETCRFLQQPQTFQPMYTSLFQAFPLKAVI